MQDIDKNQQSCIQISENAEFGRYLVAAKDIQELSIILSEVPLTYGPGDDDQEVNLGDVPMCLGCCVRIIDVHRCALCGWPICGEKCQKIEIHSRNECIIFSQRNLTYPPPHTWPIINKSILVLRCLLLKESDMEAWKNVIYTLEHHTQTRNKKSYCVKEDEMLLDNLEYILGKPLNDEQKNEIVRISGVINVNAFSTTTSHSNNGNAVMIAQCIYRTASLFSNSCVPNCSWRVRASPSFKICVRSVVPIKKGEMITISYSPHDTMCGTLQRQVSNEDVAHFICSCIRCKSPTELGTFISAIKCPTCYGQDKNGNDKEHEGYLLPVNPLVPESTWICNSKNCSESQTVNKTVGQTYAIQQMFETIKRSYLDRSDEIQALENVLEIGKKIVHLNHYIMQDIRMYIVKRQIPFVNTLVEKDLKNLIMQTQMLLNVANILAPGFSQIRALLQYFLAQELNALQSLKRLDSTSKPDDDHSVNIIKYLESQALLFFQHHNYHSENDKIIKNIKNTLKTD